MKDREECLAYVMEHAVFVFSILFTHMSTYIISLHKPNIGLRNDILYFIYFMYTHIYVSSLSSFINNQLREYINSF